MSNNPTFDRINEEGMTGEKDSREALEFQDIIDDFNLFHLIGL